jgi:hypothetical protein
MSTGPEPGPEEQDASRKRLQEEDAARGPSHDDRDEARERAGLGGHEAQPGEPPLPGPAEP